MSNPATASLEQLPDQSLRLTGRLELGSVALLWQQAGSLLSGPTQIQAQDIQFCDGAGAAFLFDLQQRGATLVGLPHEVARLLAALNPDKPLAAKQPVRAVPLLSKLGHLVHDHLADIKDQITFVGAALVALGGAIRYPRSVRWRDFFYQCEMAGANALPITSLIFFLFGVILAFQSALPLRQFGAEIFVANLLGLSLIRELAPLVAAILMAGRTGAAFAAEIGTMKVNEEVNALVTFGFDPVRFLVLPRLLAGFLMAPILTAYAELVGLFAGALVLETFGIPLVTFYNQLIGAVSLDDLLGGMFKAAIYGLEVAAIGCLRGLSTGNGASAVGLSTTRSVVQTLVVLVVTDGILAVVYYQLGI